MATKKEAEEETTDTSTKSLVHDVKADTLKNQISWMILERYFQDNPDYLVSHHLDSYNAYFSGDGIQKLLRDNNPITFTTDDGENHVQLYLGGRNGDKVYIGSPVLTGTGKHNRYMFPNEARLCNLTYASPLHIDVDVEFEYMAVTPDEKTGNIGLRTNHQTMQLHRVYLGQVPIMLRSNLCILHGMDPAVRIQMGECRNDPGGYFVLQGEEKYLVSREQFPDNELHIEKDLVSIMSVPEDTSRRSGETQVHFHEGVLYVDIPNVKTGINLFLLMRALGFLSDREIMECCLLTECKHAFFADLFLPTIHCANKTCGYTQEDAWVYISQQTDDLHVILSEFFLPHLGTNNLTEKAYFLGYMVKRLLLVHSGLESPTDKTRLQNRNVVTSGRQVADAFQECFGKFKKKLKQSIKDEYRFRRGGDDITKYHGSNFVFLISSNYRTFFQHYPRLWKESLNSLFAGPHCGTLSRTSWNDMISQLRSVSTSCPIVGSQYGYYDPIQGCVLGLVSTVTYGSSGDRVTDWLLSVWKERIYSIFAFPLTHLGSTTKVMVNGRWVGVVRSTEALEYLRDLQNLRRNGIFPVHASITFEYRLNELCIRTYSGRLSRPLYYIQSSVLSYQRKGIRTMLTEQKMDWQQIVSGMKKAEVAKAFDYKQNKLYQYSSERDWEDLRSEWTKFASVVDYVDVFEESSLLIANQPTDIEQNKWYTHMEIDSSLLLSVESSQVAYIEHLPIQLSALANTGLKQAISLYHTNHHVRMDKQKTHVLSYGQTPLVQSRLLQYENHRDIPCGVNVILAVMSLDGYNAGCAFVFNEASVQRGILRATVFNTYDTREDTLETMGPVDQKVRHNAYNYDTLDKHDGCVQLGTFVEPGLVLFGKERVVEEEYSDVSVVVEGNDPMVGGFVDQTFSGVGEDGNKIAKVRLRKESIPSLGTVCGTRCGLRGVVSMVVPEADMPFTEDGLRPDVLVNPHVFADSMAVGQLLEMILGRVVGIYGGFGDCTAFQTKGDNLSVYGALLTRQEVHSSGCQLFCNGMTGELVMCPVFVAPSYMMRFPPEEKQTCPSTRDALTRQCVGIQLEEEDVGAMVGLGMSAVLRDSMMNRGEEEGGFHMAVCNKSGMLAVYNPAKGIFMSPEVDGPLRFHLNKDGTQSVEQITRFGRTFSILKVPYAFKLLMQELQVMNIQMRILTDENIDQLGNLAFSGNLNKLAQVPANMSIPRVVEQLEGLVPQATVSRLSEILEQPVAEEEVVEEKVEEKEEEDAQKEEERVEGAGVRVEDLIQATPALQAAPRVITLPIEETTITPSKEEKDKEKEKSVLEVEAPVEEKKSEEGDKKEDNTSGEGGTESSSGSTGGIKKIITI